MIDHNYFSVVLVALIKADLVTEEVMCLLFLSLIGVFTFEEEGALVRQALLLAQDHVSWLCLSDILDVPGKGRREGSLTKIVVGLSTTDLSLGTDAQAGRTTHQPASKTTSMCHQDLLVVPLIIGTNRSIKLPILGITMVVPCILVLGRTGSILRPSSLSIHSVVLLILICSWTTLRSYLNLLIRGIAEAETFVLVVV